MTATECIAQLQTPLAPGEARDQRREADIAELRLRDQRREAEHRSVLDTYTAINADRETLRRELEADYMLLGKAVDARIAELAAHRTTGEGVSDDAVLEIARR